MDSFFGFKHASNIVKIFKKLLNQKFAVSKNSLKNFSVEFLFPPNMVVAAGNSMQSNLSC